MNQDERHGVLAGGNFIVDHIKEIDHFPKQDQLALVRTETLSNGGGPYNLLRDLAAMEVAAFEARMSERSCYILGPLHLRSERRLWPAINIKDSGTRKEHLLLTKEEYRQVTEIRRALAAKDETEQQRRKRIGRLLVFICPDGHCSEKHESR